jgi:hypothetical protein
MVKSRRNGLEDSVWACLFLIDRGKYSPIIEEASIFIKYIMHQFKLKSKKIINRQIIPRKCVRIGSDSEINLPTIVETVFRF